jgi:NAD(P)-dependent dehydrogenase (short-subunit alcohol dehydrogenase family)
MSDLSFANKVVAITGAASGIGKATAYAFASRGAAVALLDINKHVMVVAEQIVQSGGRASYYIGDVSQQLSVNQFQSITMRDFGPVNYLINNAGIEINTKGNLLDMPWADLERILQVNLTGYILCCRAFMREMPTGGRVVNVSSVQGLTAHRPGTSYQASKSGILGLTRALAIEVAQRGITVNAIAPGAIETEGIGSVRAGDPGILAGYQHRIPLGRRGTPTEVAGPIMFLCSDLANYINGTCLVIDGGYTINITP